MRAFDWSATPIGPVAKWPQSLKTCVRIVLTSRQPMFMYWGESLTFLYNDAYRAILRAKHPAALGQPGAVVWREIWDQIGPSVAAIMQHNEGMHDEALRLVLDRNGTPEEAYFTFSYSPVPNELGGAGGVICTSADETQRIHSERQQAFLREHATRTLHARTVDEVCAQTAQALATCDRDLPFALVYLADAEGRHLSLACASGIERGHPAAPQWIAMQAGSVWPVAQALADREPRVVDLVDAFGSLPSGAWPVAPRRAAVLPLAGSGDAARAVVLVAGLNPFRPLDDEYRRFLDSVLARMASSIAVARAHEEERRWHETLAEIDRPATAPALSLAPRERVIVASADDGERAQLERLLSERWSVETVRDGREALAALRREPADLVLAAARMAGLDGIGLARAIRCDAALRSTAVILISAGPGEEGAAESLDAGADDSVATPYTERQLLVRVAGRLAATKAARETNEHRKALYRLFMQAPFPIVVVHGPDHIIVLANELTLDAMGWRDASAYVGKPLADVIPEAANNGILRALDRAYQSGMIQKEVSDPFPLPTGPGGGFECHYFNRVFSPLFDDRGAIEGVIASSFDVTEQVTAQQRVDKARAEAEALAAQLTTTSQRLEAAQRVGGIGIFDWHAHEDCAYWSPEVFALMGLEPEAVEPCEDSWLRAMLPEDREVGWAAFRKACAARDDRFEVEVRFRRPDGTARWIRISALIYYDEQGAPARSLGAIVDIETLKTTARELERANRAKDEFLATMSHELRTPLNAVLGWATILGKKPRDPAQADRGLEVIQRNARTLVRLVSDLLDVSRIISGKLQLTLRRTELAAVVRAAADVVGPAADAKGVRLVLDLDPALGAIVGDPDRLQQVIWNLLTNAVRFTARGGRVTVTADRSEHGIRLRVHDTGTGIPREHLQHIFERFRQVDSSTTRAYGGLGLGLAIVRHLVEAHGGSVEAYSEGAGHGSTFTILLPIVAVDTSHVPPEIEAPATEPPPPSGVSLHDVHVLLVDDDPDSIDLLRLVLGGAGAKVTVARTAREGLDAMTFAPAPFDVIVSDIAMPGMDGYSFMRTVRSRGTGGDVPAIALSAYARAEDAARAMRAGFQEHLRKPVDPAALVEAVRAWAQLRAGGELRGS